ncbi:hypothetical protein NVV95_17915 [Herbiconiux sp. CPCC 205716]|uniref:Uncharacterized protein n=1 Tax=Herbiconiux gentiana TaxID=2970912 RepID=A0ABT2GJM6_9MICO|nr:hypothetical protein [Herbiconiux gentiana]MCS5716427.1 hypothetical protein [Herbiconiux gentiana]
MAATGETPTTQVILWWNGRGQWGARAKRGHQRGWAYVDELANLPAAAVEAARKAGGTLPAGTRVEIQRPGTIDRLLPEIDEAEARAAELRRQLRELENEIDQMRKRTFTSLRRAKLRPEDALHLLANGFTIEVPEDGNEEQG